MKENLGAPRSFVRDSNPKKVAANAGTHRSIDANGLPVVMMSPEFHKLKIPLVGVGCIVVREDGHLLLVRNHGGGWSPPGGHLDFGESPEGCAARETLEETGVRITASEFVAITNDLLVNTGKHYVTVWMRADVAGAAPIRADPAEIAEAGWFAADSLPRPLAIYFENLLAGRCLPSTPVNLPFRTVSK